MTGPTSTSKPTAKDTDAKDAPRGANQPREEAEQQLPAVSGGEIRELARTQEDVAERARALVVADLGTSDQNGSGEQRRIERLVDSVRADLMTELRGQEQERARGQLAEAARSGEAAVAGVVQAISTVVRGIVPAAVVRPEDVIEATFALADQGLRVGRRFALTMATSVRSLSQAA